jgi:hypothetical protein
VVVQLNDHSRFTADDVRVACSLTEDIATYIAGTQMLDFYFPQRSWLRLAVLSLGDAAEDSFTAILPAGMDNLTLPIRSYAAELSLIRYAAFTSVLTVVGADPASCWLR